MAEGSPKVVGALVAGLRILRHLSSRRAPAGVTQIARDLKLNPSTCFNLLRTLAAEGLLVFDEATKTYRPGLGLLELARGSLEPVSYARLARPELERLAARHQVTASLWQRSGSDRVVLVDSAVSAAAIQLQLSIGQRLPWGIGALGRCFMAQAALSPDEIARQFEGLRWQNPPRLEHYLADIRRAKEEGYAIDRENYVKGVTTVSSVVADPAGTPLMAVSVVAFSAQLDGRAVRDLGRDVRSSAARIAGALPAAAMPADVDNQRAVRRIL